MPRIPRISPTLAIAGTALVVSLGGTTYAATALPSASVGTTQLKAGAVTSAKVKNGSLKRLDFTLGQLPAGPAGPQGPAGRKGDRGPAGAVGPAGTIATAGLPDALVDINAGPIPVGTSGDTRLASLRIEQPGAYVLWSKVWLTRPTAGQPTQHICRLAAENDVDLTWFTAVTGAPVATANLITHEFASAGTVNLFCNAAGASTARDATIVAIRVRTLTRSVG